MKKITLLIAMLLLVITGSFAQASLYTFAQSNGTYTPITGGTQVTSSTDGSTDLDTYVSTLQAFPVPFKFTGVVYTGFYVTGNGQITLGGPAPYSNYSGVLSINFPSNAVIAPFSADLDDGTSGLAEIRHEQIGNELVIQWSNFRRAVSAESFNFQARLNTVNGEIKFVYEGVTPYDASTATQPQIGLKSSTATNGYIALTVASGGSWNTPTVITTGISSGSVATFNSTTYFANGLTYTFTAPAGCGPDAIAGGTLAPANSNVCNGGTVSAIAITGASNSTYYGVSHEWQQSTDNGTSWVNAVGGTVATASYTPPVFAGSAIKYRLKVSCSGTDAYSSEATVNPMVGPATQASALKFINSGYDASTISWTNGNGARRHVLISTVPITDPVSGTTPAYSTNATYAGGQQLVYDGTASSINIRGLACNTIYYVKVFEYIRCGTGPYDVYFNTTTGTNSLTFSSPTSSTLPITNNFTGFTGGANLTEVQPGWFEAGIFSTVGPPPESNPSSSIDLAVLAWANSTSLGGTTAKLNLSSNTKNEWVISPKVSITAASRIKLKAAITNVNSANADETGMAGTDDKIKVMISTDGCGSTWTSLYTFDASNTTTLTNALQDFKIDIPATYIGQTVQIAIVGTDGPINNGTTSSTNSKYDFHIDDLLVEVTPVCDKPVLTATTNITKNSATINWNVPAVGIPTGYEYVVSTSNTPPTGAGTVVATNTVNVGSLTPSTVYYVFVRTVCGGDFSDWSVSGTFGTLCDVGNISSTTPGTRCGAGTVELSAAASGGNVKWYSAQTDLIPVATGATYSPSVTATTTFYAAADAGAGTGIIGTDTLLTDNMDKLTAFNNRWSGYKMQLIYTAAELSGAGLSAGSINSIAFNTTTLGDGATNSGFTVRMGATAVANFNTSDTFVTSGFSTVYGPVTHTHTASGWQVINFSTPYIWDGTSNVIIEVAMAGADMTNNARTYHTLTGSDTILYQSSLTSLTGIQSNERLNILFGTCTSAKVAVVATVTAPPTFTLSANLVNVCLGESSALVTIASGASDYDVFTWTPSAGVSGNATSGWIFNTTVSTTYTLQVSQSAGAMCANSATVNVAVNRYPSDMSISASPIETCIQTAQPLTATGGNFGGSATIGAATTLTGSIEQPTAFCNRHENYRMQLIYTAAELNAAGLYAGNITSLAFNVNTLGSAATNDNYIVKIGTVTATSFASISFLDPTGFSTVYGPITHTHTDTGLQVITFTTPYSWDGVSNIILDIAHDGADSFDNTQTYYTETATDRVVYDYAYNEVSTAAFAVSKKRPNIVLQSSGSVTTTWSPVANLYTDAAGTVAYSSGANAKTVYFKSATASPDVVYTATATTNNLCTKTATVSVSVNSADAPTVPAPTQDFCNAGIVADLVATGTAIKWYAASTGGTALAGTTALINNTQYYASQTVNGCESVVRTARTAIINAPAPIVADNTPEFCNAATVADLMPNGADIKWYDASTGGNLLVATTTLVSGTHYFASKTINGCEGLVRGEVTATINVVAAPAIDNAAQTFCNAATVADLMPNGADIKWYDASTGGNLLVATTTLVSGTHYFASQTINGCEGLVRGEVTATINVVAAPAIDNAAQTFCNAATVADLMPNGADIKWYDASTGGNLLVATTTLVSGTHYFASQTINGCEGLVRGEVTATINVVAAPAIDNAAQTFCNAATVADLMPNGADIKWYDASTGGNLLVATTTLVSGTHYFASQTINGCEGLVRGEVTATINVVAAPAIDNAAQTFCNAATVADLMPNGADIKWYDASTGGNLLVATTTLVSGTHYFASKTINGCEGLVRGEVTATINVVAAPTGDNTQTINGNVASDATVADLQADTTAGGTVTWYASETNAQAGTNPLTADTQLVQGATYYATQTVGTCTSVEVFAVTVDVVLGRETFVVNDFTYHPNPVKDILSLSYSSEITSVTVFNLLGQQVLVQQANATDVKVDMSSLADGTYVVNITAGNTAKTIKVIKKQ